MFLVTTTITSQMYRGWVVSLVEVEATLHAHHRTAFDVPKHQVAFVPLDCVCVCGG